MKIDVKPTATDIQVLKCGGSFDADAVNDFKKLTNLLVQEGKTQFVVDCTELTFVDSMGLGAMISLLRKLREREGDLKVASLNEEVKTIFEITRLHRLFEICESAESACNNFQK